MKKIRISLYLRATPRRRKAQRKARVLLSIFSLIAFIATNPVVAQETDRVSNSATSSSIKSNFYQQENKRHLTISAKDLLAQGVAQVTGVELNQTDKGLQVILKTAAGGQLVPLIGVA